MAMHDRDECLALLSRPWTRTELILRLEELATADPRPVWTEEIRNGLASGVDEVIHFFFDDHDLDERALGEVLVDEGEVAAMRVLLAALDHLVRRLPRGDDDDYVRHPDWPAVTMAARTALARLRA